MGLAKRVVAAVRKRGAVRDDELATALGVELAELRLAIAIAIRWKQVDRCSNYLVVPARREGRTAA